MLNKANEQKDVEKNREKRKKDSKQSSKHYLNYYDLMCSLSFEVQDDCIVLHE